MAFFSRLFAWLRRKPPQPVFDESEAYRRLHGERVTEIVVTPSRRPRRGSCRSSEATTCAAASRSASSGATPRTSRPGVSWNVRARFERLAVSVVAVAAVTGAVFGLDRVAPVLSLGVLYLFAVLPVAVFYGLGGRSRSRS